MSVRVWGKFALFTHPELKVKRPVGVHRPSGSQQFHNSLTPVDGEPSAMH
jgi:hypothetical protein